MLPAPSKPCSRAGLVQWRVASNAVVCGHLAERGTHEARMGTEGGPSRRLVELQSLEDTPADAD
jgi:hypothetical protein